MFANRLLLGWLVLIVGLGLALYAIAGAGGLISCGRWGLDCLVPAIAIVFVAHCLGAWLFFQSWHASVVKTFGRYISLLSLVWATLAAGAAGVLVAMLLLDFVAKH